MIMQQHNNKLYCIHQKEHALLAAFIIKNLPSFHHLAPSIKDDLYIATLHHDDGWENYDKNLIYNKKFHISQNFTEISTNNHIEILTSSREAISKKNNLARYLVCSHNIYLATLRQSTLNILIEKKKLEYFIQNETKILHTQLNHLASIPISTLNECTHLLRLADWLSLCSCLKKLVPNNTKGLNLNIDDYPIITCHPKLIKSPLDFHINKLTIDKKSKKIERNKLKLTFN